MHAVPQRPCMRRQGSAASCVPRWRIRAICFRCMYRMQQWDLQCGTWSGNMHAVPGRCLLPYQIGAAGALRPGLLLHRWLGCMPPVPCRQVVRPQHVNAGGLRQWLVLAPKLGVLRGVPRWSRVRCAGCQTHAMCEGLRKPWFFRRVRRLRRWDLRGGRGYADVPRVPARFAMQRRHRAATVVCKWHHLCGEANNVCRLRSWEIQWARGYGLR